MRISFLLLVLMLLTSKPRAQEKTMLPEQERLSVFIGSWTVDGSETTYLEVCNRIQGNHIECKAAGDENGKQDSSTSFLSYAPLEKSYVYYGLYSSGNSRTLRGNWENDRFVFTGQRITTEKTTRWKVTIRPIERNLHFIEEASVNDGAWEKKADFIYKRVK